MVALGTPPSDPSTARPGNECTWHRKEHEHDEHEELEVDLAHGGEDRGGGCERKQQRMKKRTWNCQNLHRTSTIRLGGVVLIHEILKVDGGGWKTTGIAVNVLAGHTHRATVWHGGGGAGTGQR